MKKIITLFLLVLSITFTLSSCNLKNLPYNMPLDFNFSITFGTYGISSYDSKTGILIKDKNATNPLDYTTTCHLSDENLKTIYKLIYKLNINFYPDEFPNGSFAISSPYMKLSLSVSTDAYSKTINADNVGYGSARSIRGQIYLNTINEIKNIITATKEWKALPDYEFYYD